MLDHRRDACPEIAGSPQLEHLPFPAAVAQEGRRRMPEPGGCPELGKQEQRRTVARALGADRGRVQHDPLQRKKPSALSSRPRASFGTPKGPLSPETGLSLSRTYVPSVTKREAKEPSLLLLLGGLLLRGSLLLRLARRPSPNSHECLLVASPRKPVCLRDQLLPQARTPSNLSATPRLRSIEVHGCNSQETTAVLEIFF